MSKYEILFESLYRSHQLHQYLAFLRHYEPAHGWAPIDRKTNNIGPINLSSSPHGAIIEGVTNGLDAVIMQAFPLPDPMDGPDPARPTSVADALRLIPGPHVDVYWQEASGIPSKKTVSLLDRGTGMTETQMISGPLAFGSEAKPLNPIQHGSFGQGGATLYGQSDGSLIASRMAGSNQIVFTIVYKHQMPNGMNSYCYAVNATGGLFKADVGKLALVNPDQLNGMTQVAHQLASWRPQFGGQETIIFPQHGTLRRQIGMSVAYSPGTSSGESLWRGLRDNLFASEGVIRLIGDRITAKEPGRYAYPAVAMIRSARSKFRATKIGDKIASDHSPVLHNFTDATPQRVEVGKSMTGKPRMGEVDIEVYAFEGYVNGKGEPQNITRHWLDVASLKEGIKGVFVTLNGQVHARLLSAYVIPNKWPWIINHVIVHVMLDRLPVDVLQEVLVANRESLKSGFAPKLRDVLRDFLGNGPCADYLDQLNIKMAPSAHLDTDACSDSALMANALLDNPIIGSILGHGSNNIHGKPEHAPNKTGVTSPKESAASTGQASKPMQLLASPTMLDIRKDDFVRGKEEWLTLRVNTYDHHNTQVVLSLPSGFSFAPGCKPLRDGRKSYRISCHDKAPANATFTAAFVTPNGASLTTTKTIQVLDDRPKTARPSASTTNHQTAPQPQWVEVRLADPTEKHADKFEAAGEDVGLKLFNYTRTDDKIYIFVNFDHPKLMEITDLVVRTYGRHLLDDFRRRLWTKLTMAAIVHCDDGIGIGQNGATTEQEFGILRCAALAHLADVISLYQDKSLLKAIDSGRHAKHEDILA